MKLALLAVFFMAIFSENLNSQSATTTANGATEPIRVEQGLLAGAPGRTTGIRVYRGIPYAAPPVGDLRWRAPQPPASWQGVREATKFGPTCWQTPYPPAAAIFQNDISSLSEDCLYLNIWTPAKAATDRLPVMVWIHGGAWSRGASTTPMYDGENFAQKGVVLVTLNYRLGVLGFLAHPELSAESEHHSSGNYGLLDAVAALHWVKKNIAAFGGDPNRVTIFGESAGSWSVCGLMASPLATGLFDRAIGESGGLFGLLQTKEKAEKEGERIAGALGVTGSGKDVIKSLRAKSAEELVKSNPESIRANVDGWFLPRDIFTTYAQGKQNDVPLLVGSNSDEGTIFAPPPGMLTSELFVGGVRQRFGAMAGQYLKIYPGGSPEEAVASYVASLRDQTFGWEMRTWARMQLNSGHHPVYRYYFSRRPPGRQSARLGAFHASEIPYVFGNFEWPFPWEDADRKLSETMSSYWVNFAATGNPNGKGVPEWPSYDPEKDASLELGDKVAVREQINKAGLDFYDAYFQSRAQAAAVASGK